MLQGQGKESANGMKCQGENKPESECTFPGGLPGMTPWLPTYLGTFTNTYVQGQFKNQAEQGSSYAA